MKAIARLIILLLLSAAALAQNTGLSSASPEEQQVFDSVNQERTKRGLSALTWDDRLAQSARDHAQELASHESLSHRFPGEPKLSERIAKTGLRFNRSGENVAFASSAEKVHRGLMHSPPHRANILSPKYNAIGIGVVERNGYLYVTQNFAFALKEVGEPQFEDQIVEAAQHLRHERGLPPLERVDDASLRSKACNEKIDLEDLLRNTPASRQAVSYTASQATELSSSMRGRVLDPSAHRFAVGACFAPGAKYGYGTFWVLAVFFR